MKVLSLCTWNVPSFSVFKTHIKSVHCKNLVKKYSLFVLNFCIMTWNKPLVYLECRRNILWSFLFFLSRVINEGCKAHIAGFWKKSDNKKTFKCLKHLKCLRIPHLRCILRNTCNVDFVHLREAIIPKIFDEVRLHFDFVKLSIYIKNNSRIHFV